MSDGVWRTSDWSEVDKANGDLLYVGSSDNLYKRLAPRYRHNMWKMVLPREESRIFVAVWFYRDDESSVQAQWIERLLKAQAPLIVAIKDMNLALKSVPFPQSTTTVTTVNGRSYIPARKPYDPLDIVTPSLPVEHLPQKCQRMLGALVQGEAMGLVSMPFRNVAIIAGVSPASGTTRNRKAVLTGGGYVTTVGDNVQLTPKGRAYPIDVELPPTESDALLEFWKREIGTDKIAKMLEAVVLSGPLSDSALAEAAGMEMSGTFRNYKAALTGRGLIVKRGDAYEASEVFTR